MIVRYTTKTKSTVPSNGTHPNFYSEIKNRNTWQIALGKHIKKGDYTGSFSVRQDLTDNMLNAGQMGLSWKSKDWAITFGTGAFSYIDLKNTLPANVPIGTTNASGNGNTLDVNGNYTSNYDVSEYFLEVKRKLGSVDLMVFYEHLQNGNISEYNKAAAYGILAAYGSWSFGCTQQEVQKDAVVGAFTDSDFAGGVTSS